MKVLIDEDVADPFVAMLVHLLPTHEITSVRASGWSGKKDVPLYADAARRGFKVMVSANHHQLLIPDEVRAIRKSKMHVVHYEQTDGISGLGRTAGGLLAAIVPVIVDLMPRAANFSYESRAFPQGRGMRSPTPEEPAEVLP